MSSLNTQTMFPYLTTCRHNIHHAIAQSVYVTRIPQAIGTNSPPTISKHNRNRAFWLEASDLEVKSATPTAISVT